MRHMASLLDTGEQDSGVLERNEAFATFWMIYWDNKDRYLLMHRDLERFLSYPFSFMYDTSLYFASCFASWFISFSILTFLKLI